MKIDINRLHEVINEKRTDGKSVAMLTIALGYADFEIPFVYIFCENKNNLICQKNKFIEILISINFFWGEITEKKILVEKTTYIFETHPNTKTPYPKSTKDKIYLFDNYYMEQYLLKQKEQRIKRRFNI